jgi:hypothetical protein
MILRPFEEAVWHRRGSDGDVAEPRHHGGKIVSPVLGAMSCSSMQSAIRPLFEFGEIAGHMLVADGRIGASDGVLDVAEGSVGPPERRVQGGVAAGSGDDRLMHAAGVAERR